MAANEGEGRVTGRREFLKVSAAAAASGLVLGRAAQAEDEAAAAAELLPAIQLGEHRISRLVAGWNPIGGHSHSTLNMARFMREYFTVERTVEFLQKCQSEGITAWQYDHTEKGVEAIRLAREAGNKMKFICLHAERTLDAPIKEVIDDTAPIAMVHHGGVTDAMFRAGKQEKVRDFVKKVHDHGILAGVSAHNPENIKRIADEGWENDLFMCCFYYVTRPREQQEENQGKVTVGEPFFESDPGEMTAVIRQVDKPCLGFKILAAARLGWSTYQVARCFKFAFENIKSTDGVIVGMFPVYYDEVRDNAEHTRKFGAS